MTGLRDGRIIMRAIRSHRINLSNLIVEAQCFGRFEPDGPVNIKVFVRDEFDNQLAKIGKMSVP